MSGGCSCRSHTLYIYRVVENTHQSFERYSGWEYAGVHSCGRCSGDLSDRHYMGSSTHQAYRALKAEAPELLQLSYSKDFSSCEELDDAEAELVDAEYVLRSNTFNRSLGGGRSVNPRLTTCILCAGTLASHRKSCSLYLAPKGCSECGALTQHLKVCSKHRFRVCGECSSRGSHYKSCSKYPKKPDCLTCAGRAGAHLKFCEKYIKPSVCGECDSPLTSHKVSCSRFARRSCKECESLSSSHRKDCSRFSKRKISCIVCGSRSGATHKKACSNFSSLVTCEGCGSRSGGQHRVHCELYKPKRTCEECGSTAAVHRSGCSRRRPQKLCEECGSRGSIHRKSCSLYKSSPPCSECARDRPQHDIACSKYVKPKVCQECSGRHNKHKGACSLYKVKACSGCGSPTNHKNFCTLRKRTNTDD